MTRLITGMPAPPHTTSNLSGERIHLPRPETWTLLSFLRYASCPACNLRVRELRLRGDELQSARVEWFAVFHSPGWRLERHMPAEVWGNVIPDLECDLSGKYSTTRSWLGVGLSMVLPTFYWAYLKTLSFGYWGGAVDRWFHTMPADVLIAPDGTIAFAHYGRHMVDHVDVGGVLDAVRRFVPRPVVADCEGRANLEASGLHSLLQQRR